MNEMSPERAIKRTLQFCLNIVKNGIQVPRKLDSVEAINLSMTEYDPVLKGLEGMQHIATGDMIDVSVKHVLDEENKLD